MIVEVAREALLSVGGRSRADYLVEQAGYTLGLAELDGEALAALLPDGFLDEVRRARDEVVAVRQDRALTAAESKDARRLHVKAFADAKVWRRAVAGRAALALRLGRPLPDGLTRISNARTPLQLSAQVAAMVKLLEASLDQLPGAGKEELLAQGRELATALQTTDATQKVKRLGQLPAASILHRHAGGRSAKVPTQPAPEGQ